MAFIAPIIAGVIGLGSIGSAIVGIGLSLGASLILKSIGKKDTTKSGGVSQDVQLGGDVPRSAIFGKQATAGQLVYVNTYGADYKYLQLVYVIGDGEHESLDQMFVNGKPVTLAATPTTMGTPVPEFSNKMWVRWFSGSLAQSADTQLSANANPVGRWSVNHRLAGMAYVSLTLEYDETVYQGGIPEFLFGVKGLKLYDPRKDSTVGGAGAHRWSMPSTWEWSDNVAIALYNYRRGIWQNGERVLGMGLPAQDLRTDYYIAAANACDEPVSLKAGGNEKRYRIGIQVQEDGAHSGWIEKFLDAMAGVEIDRAGEFSPLAGVAQMPVMSITDGDLILDAPLSYTARLSRSDRVNAVFGTYSDPGQQYQAVAFPPRTSANDELADGGERFARELDLTPVLSGTQAQRISEVERKKGRFQGSATLNFPFKFIVLEPGDWIEWTSARFGFTKTWQVVTTQLSPQKLVTVQLREIAASVYAWDAAADELAGAVAVDLPGAGIRQSVVAGLTVTAVEIVADGGQKRPALKVNWNPIGDATVDIMIFEYEIVGTTGKVQERYNRPQDGEYLILSGIQANTNYELRANIETTPKRLTTWTVWVPTVTTKNNIVTTVVPGGISAAQLDQRIARSVFNAFTLFGKQYDDFHSGLIENAVEIQQMSRNVSASVNGVSASFKEQINVLVGQYSALAEQITSVSAIANGISANGQITFVAEAAPTGAVAAYRLILQAGNISTGFLVIAMNDGTSKIINDAGEIWAGETGPIRFENLDTDHPALTMYDAT